MFCLMKIKVSNCCRSLHNHWFPPVRFYWHRVHSVIAGLIDCSPGDPILDFGCGWEKILKKYLPQHNVIGYDIIKEYSDVDDYKNLKPHTIVCSHVLEHLKESELESTLKNFAKMAPKCLITAQPTENIISQIAWLFSDDKKLAKKLKPAEHQLAMNKVHSYLNKLFIAQERRNVLTLTVISKWVIRNP